MTDTTPLRPTSIRLPEASEQPGVLWLVWDCADMAGAYHTERQATQAMADLLDRVRSDFGPDPRRPDTVTIQRVWPTPPAVGRTP